MYNSVIGKCFDAIGYAANEGHPACKKF